MDLQARLLELMEARDMTVASLSEASGVPYTTLKSILDGVSHSPKISTVHKIAIGFGLSIEELLGLDLPGGVARLDEGEDAMLKAYRKLPKARQETHWKAIMRALANEPA